MWAVLYLYWRLLFMWDLNLPGSGKCSAETTLIFATFSFFPSYNDDCVQVRQLVPPNLVQATMQHTTTKLIKPPKDCDPTCIDEKSGDLRNVSDKLTWATKQDTVDGTNTLGLIVFAIVLGTALAQLGDKG